VAALLALALAFASAPFGHSPALSVGYEAEDVRHAADMHPEANCLHPSHGGIAKIDCEKPTIACCGMAHCQPGIAAICQDAPPVDAGACAAASDPSPRSGAGPEVIPPPPRRPIV
jgi:hypothetical protein